MSKRVTRSKNLAASSPSSSSSPLVLNDNSYLDKTKSQANTLRRNMAKKSKEIENSQTTIQNLRSDYDRELASSSTCTQYSACTSSATTSASAIDSSIRLGQSEPTHTGTAGEILAFMLEQSKESNLLI